MKLLAIVGLVSVCTLLGAPASRASDFHSYVSTLLHKAYQTHGSSQVILVMAHAADGPRASLVAYAFKAGHWQKTMAKIPAVIGRGGITLDKHEGDLKSPAGIFYLGPGFGSAPEPAGVKLPYKRTTKNDYWIDDPTSADYNKWIRYAGDPDKRWKSYERLLIPAYQYAVVIRYNMNPIIKGRGSAIFLHIWPGPNGSTVGCTAVSKHHLIDLLKWLDPENRPVIIQGTVSQLKMLARR